MPIGLLTGMLVLIRVFGRAILLMMVSAVFLLSFRGIALAQPVACTCGLRLVLLLRLLRRLLLIRLPRRLLPVRLLRRLLRLLLLPRRIRFARLGRFARRERRLRHSAWVNARRTRFPALAIWC